MKEINLHNPAFGKDKKDRDSSVKNIVSELTIIKEQVSQNIPGISFIEITGVLFQTVVWYLGFWMPTGK